MNAGSFESLNASPHTDTGATAAEYEQQLYDREFDDIVAYLENENDERSPDEFELEPALRPELEQNPQMAWPEGNPDGTIEESEYSKRLDWRLTGLGFALDAITDAIASDDQAAEWAELKQVIAATKTVGNIYDKVDYVIELEKAVTEFALPLGATNQDYLGGRQ